jgi:acetyl esterase/lipase
MAKPPVVDPYYLSLLEDSIPTPRPPAADVYAVRNSVNTATAAASAALSFPDGMIASISEAKSLDGTTFEITRFLPLAVQNSTSGPPDRAIIFGFGGGMVGGSVKLFYNIIATLAENTSTQVFAPDYRLAPENPYPAGLEDYYSTITWLQENASTFNVDPARIILFGQSAGGNLAASASLMARDKGLNPPVAAQVLRYPMLDDQTTMSVDDPRLPYLTVTPSSNELVWTAYMGGLNRGKDIIRFIYSWLVSDANT